MNKRVSVLSRNTFRQAAWELKLNVKNGEQLLLLVLIPIAVLVTLTQTSIISGEKWDVASALSVAITVAILAAGFTSLAISTAFERRSGTLVTMGVTPISKVELVTGKTLSTLYLATISTLILLLVSLVLGWVPTLQAIFIPLSLMLGIASVTGLAFLIAGTMRAEAVLAVANAIFVMSMIFGGILFQYSGFAGVVTNLFPPAALSNCMSFAFNTSSADSPNLFISVGVLVGWSIAGTFAAARYFKWR